jgi:hypothetical protein
MIIGALTQHRRSDTSGLVNQRHRGDVWVARRCDANYPGAQSICLGLNSAHDRSGPVHEQSAQIHVTSLANAEQALLSSRAVCVV